MNSKSIPHHPQADEEDMDEDMMEYAEIIRSMEERGELSERQLTEFYKLATEYRCYPHHTHKVIIKGKIHRLIWSVIREAKSLERGS